MAVVAYGCSVSDSFLYFVLCFYFNHMCNVFILHNVFILITEGR